MSFLLTVVSDPTASSPIDEQEAAMAPVILAMNVHCYGCAGNIREVIKNLFGT